MSDDAVDYGGSSDSDAPESESEQVPSRLPLSSSGIVHFGAYNMSDLSVLLCSLRMRMRAIIAGIDVDRRHRRDLLRPLHVVPAPPQAVTLTPRDSDRDAGAADDGDYELEERSAGNLPVNTPRRRFGPFFLG